MTAADADAARARLARALRASGRTPSLAVQAAFAAVPRHLFVPGLSPAAAYQDEALVIKYGPDGLPISSSSQPAMMAIMLEQLGLEPGHSVLEIGTGTGYNAAVMAHVAGPGGRVVTVDIDPELVGRARASLAAAGFGQVQAHCADGGYGAPSDAPFDRIIVTAGAWDIAPAWLDQLTPRGRLVLPLAVRGIQLSVGLERPGPAAGYWTSTPPLRCGFVRMAGAFADPEPFRLLGDASGLLVQAADGRLAATEAVAAALAFPAADLTTTIQALSRDDLSDLDLWLALVEPDLDRLSFAAAPGSPGPGPGLPFGALALAGDGVGELSLSGLAGPPGPGARSWPELDPARYPVGIGLRGYGAAGADLAGRLASQVLAWHDQGRPATADLGLTVWPAGTAPWPGAGQVRLERPHVQLIVGWPLR